MKPTQLLFDFGKAFAGALKLLPEPKQPPAPQPALPTRPTRDKTLENLCVWLLREAGAPDLAVTVFWNPRLRTTAGYAKSRKRAIHLNPKLIGISPGEVQRTLRHELAHLLAAHRAGRHRIQPHGSEWQTACRDLGIPDEPRCHNLPFTRRTLTRKFFYACPHCGIVLARVRPLKRSNACLKCCRQHSGGHYDDRFRFKPIPAPDNARAA